MWGWFMNSISGDIPHWVRNQTLFLSASFAKFSLGRSLVQRCQRPGYPPSWSCCAPCATIVATWSCRVAVIFALRNPPRSKGICSLSKDPVKQIQGYSIEFSTFAIYFKEVHKWNEAAWNKLAILFPSRMRLSIFPTSAERLDRIYGDCLFNHQLANSVQKTSQDQACRFDSNCTGKSFSKIRKPRRGKGACHFRCLEV